MTTRNPITGDKIKTKPTSARFRDNFDNIFGKKEDKKDEQDKKDRSTK